MFNYTAIFCYCLLPFIVTNPYYPILEGQIVSQSILVAFAICLYSALNMVYTDFITNKNTDFSEFINTLFLPILLIFPLAFLYTAVLYALYYSLALKFILLVWLPLWILAVYILEMEDVPRGDILHYKIAGSALLLSVYIYSIAYMSARLVNMV